MTVPSRFAESLAGRYHGPRILTIFDSPERQPTRYGLKVHRDRLYFTRGEHQADISVITLESRE